MKFLHTSDWHLGQRLLNKDRTDEQEAALDQLLQIIRDQKVDVLLVSGDIFDTVNPPHTARQLYYRFLANLIGSSCRHVIITGGNHDSPGLLEASRELLSLLDIYVVGAIAEPPDFPLIPLRDSNGQLEALVAAVPFLRDRDLRFASPGEMAEDRILALREALASYFQQIGNAARAVEGAANVPVLAMAHLFAIGAESSERQDNIYMGDVENIRSSSFPEVFSYVALGHIHRAQKVGNDPRVHYAGSLIPLSFSETKDEKSVYILEYNGAQLVQIVAQPIHATRRLKTITAQSLLEAKNRIQAFSQARNELFTPWLDVLIQSDSPIPGVEKELTDFAADLGMELLKLRILSNNRVLHAATGLEMLVDFSPLDVFQRFCEAKKLAPAITEQVTATFVELLDLQKSKSQSH